MTVIKTETVSMVGCIDDTMDVDILVHDYRGIISGRMDITGQCGDMNLMIVGVADTVELGTDAAGGRIATLTTQPFLFADFNQVNPYDRTLAVATVVVGADRTLSLLVTAVDGGAVLADSKGPIALTTGSVRF